MESYIVDAIRTPIGNLGGGLSTLRADDLAAIPLSELLKRNPNLDPATVDDVILGCHNQAGEDNRNVARMALLLAGLPYTVPGETVNRLCASGMSAVVHAHRAIKSGDGHVFIAGGVEHMTRGPYVMSKSGKPFGGDSQLFDSSFGWRFVNPKMKDTYGTDPMGITAENLAERYSISRVDQDIFALNSQQKANQAQLSGLFEKEIVPVKLEDKKGNVTYFSKDEFLKPSTNLETLAKLKPAFKKDGTVTAGNSSGLNDGSAAMLIVSEQGLKLNNFKPLARIVSSAVSGVEPAYMGFGPVPATNLALKKAGITLKDIDIIELNEAFSAQCLAVTRGLKMEDNDPRLNPNGGALALGHPLGMSGTRIIQAAVNQLLSSNKKYALATMCIGVGMGYAVILEKI